MKIIKYNFTLFITLLALLGCETKRENEDWKKVIENKDFNGYLLFCLKYPESKNFEKSIDSYFIEREKYWNENHIPPIECFSSCGHIEVGINNGEILFEHELVKTDTLSKLLCEFIINKENNSEWPSKFNLKDLNGRKRLVSKGYFEVSFDKKSHRCFEACY